MATLLDPRLKLMNAWPEETRRETINMLHDEFKFWQNKIATDELDTCHEETATPRFMKKIFNISSNNSNQIKANEISQYLNETLVPVLSESADIYDWWRTNQHSFPILSRIARKYLSIPATSVPSERLFSDAGNQITSKRNQISSEVISKLMFIKRNSLYCKIWV